MSKIVSLYSTIDICCPTCGEIMEVYGLDVSMTVEHYDVGRRIDECAFEIECSDCKKKITVNPELHIEVSHP